MDKEIEFLKKNLQLALELRFSEYGIKPSSSIEKVGYIIEQINEPKDIHRKYERYSWLFSGKSLGNYCRALKSLTSGILDKVNLLITKDDFDLAEIRSFVTKPLIRDLNMVLNEEEGYKNKLEKSSVILNKSGLTNLFPTNSILIDSINSLYGFRHEELTKLLNDLTRLNDYGRFGSVLLRRFEVEDQPIKPLGTMGFCWNKKRNLIEDLVKFHTFLRELNFIEKDTSINLFKTGFDCTFLEDPLNIKWTKLVKGKSSKALLFHFIDELEHFNYINITEQNSILFKKIEYVFCDHSGERFQNLDVSKSQWLNQRKSERTPQEFQLDNIMYTVS